jgi:transcriptional regulator with XRE-family HTH domain
MEFTARNDIELGAAIRSARANAGLTQAELARQAGVSRAFIIKLETGQGPRSELMRVFQVLRALGLQFRIEKVPELTGEMAEIYAAYKESQRQRTQNH